MIPSKALHGSVVRLNGTVLDLDARGSRFKTQQRQYLSLLHIQCTLINGIWAKFQTDLLMLVDLVIRRTSPTFPNQSNQNITYYIVQWRKWKLPLYCCTSCAVNRNTSLHPVSMLKQKPYFYLSILFNLSTLFCQFIQCTIFILIQMTEVF